MPVKTFPFGVSTTNSTVLCLLYTFLLLHTPSISFLSLSLLCFSALALSLPLDVSTLFILVLFVRHYFVFFTKFYTKVAFSHI